MHRRPLSYLLVASAILCATLLPPRLAHTAAPPAAAPAGADQLYAQAQQHYLAKRYTEALPLFEQLVREQHSPNARLYVARCLRELGRLAPAHDQMATTVAEATARAKIEPRFATTRDTATRELAKLRQRVAQITLELAERPAGLVVEIGGTPVRADQLGTPITVMPGTLRLRAEATGFAPFRLELSVAAGSTTSTAIALTPLATPAPAPGAPPTPSSAAPAPAAPTPGASTAAPRGVSPAPGSDRPPAGKSTVLLGTGLALTGFGVLCGAGFGVLRVIAASRFDSISQACGGGHCPDNSHDDDIDTGEIIDIVAHASLGLGAASLVTAAVVLGVYAAGSEVATATAPASGRLELQADGHGAALFWTVALPL